MTVELLDLCSIKEFIFCILIGKKVAFSADAFVGTNTETSARNVDALRKEKMKMKTGSFIDLRFFVPCFPAFFDLLISLDQTGLIILL